MIRRIKPESVRRFLFVLVVNVVVVLMVACAAVNEPDTEPNWNGWSRRIDITVSKTHVVVCYGYYQKGISCVLLDRDDLQDGQERDIRNLDGQ